jgi:hypothetical protein
MMPAPSLGIDPGTMKRMPPAGEGIEYCPVGDYWGFPPGSISGTIGS